MNVELLARFQFALTIMFHYIYVPLSIGLGVVMVLTEGIYLKTRNPLYERMTRFFVRVFALTFAMGVATGIVMEFQFGTNWARYSRFVGDVFGSALAAEGIFAFFLESGFLGILVFGWNKVGPRMHFFSTCMVALGSTFSAVWIVIANSWMHTPAGFRIVGTGDAARAEITDFWQVVFNPSSVERLTHVLGGCWAAAAFLVVSISAYYMLKGRHLEFARAAMTLGLTMALVVGLYQLWTGHRNAVMIAKYQPTKLAAFEGHYKTAPGDLYLFGWVDDANETVRYGVKIPGMLSVLLYGDAKRPVRGLNEFPRADRPPVQIVFQSYHLMVAIGMTLIGLSALGLLLHWRGRLERFRAFLWVLTVSVVLPQIANQAGWVATEVGRQPWIVYGLLRTSEGVSRNVEGGKVLFSIILFTSIYILLFALFLFLLDRKIKHGPEEPSQAERGLAGA